MIDSTAIYPISRILPSFLLVHGALCCRLRSRKGSLCRAGETRRFRPDIDTMEASETTPLLDQRHDGASLDQPKATAVSAVKSLTANVALLQLPPKGSPLERSLVRRLDIFLMTFGCISQIIKYALVFICSDGCC